MLEDSIIQKVVEAWEIDQAHPLREKIFSPLPPYSHIKRVIETAFLASLEREEGMPVRFALVIVEQEIIHEIDEERTTSEYLFHLRTPLELSVDSITKLAPSLDPSISAMAVGTREGEEELYIWGIFTFSPTLSRFNEIPIWVYGELAYRPDFFTVYAVDAGSLLIARHHSQLGRILNGEFLPATPSPFTLKSLGSYMMSSVQNHELYSRHGEAYWQIYREAVELLLSEASARGHGSIFIFIPSGNSHPLYYTPRFSFREKVSVRNLLEPLLQNELDISTSIAMRKAIAERIKLLAQLGVIDGAVILTTEMDLICFGAILSAPPWSGRIVTGPDGFGEGGGETVNPSRLGTRHNSAIAFAGENKGSLAFVISQDGPVRAIVSGEDGSLLYWPDCSVSMYL